MVLDLGSGSGKSARSMKGEVVAVDFSSIALKAVREHLSSVSAVCANIRNLPFRESVFDFIRASFVLDHLTGSEQNEAMEGIRKVMKPGAQIAIECFSVSDGRFARAPLDKHGDFVDGDGILHHPFNKAEVANLVSGMDIELLTERSWEQGIGSGETMKRFIFRVLARK
jgi:SAM-dependent methyltransferase